MENKDENLGGRYLQKLDEVSLYLRDALKNNQQIEPELLQLVWESFNIDRMSSDLIQQSLKEQFGEKQTDALQKKVLGQILEMLETNSFKAMVQNAPEQAMITEQERQKQVKILNAMVHGIKKVSPNAAYTR